MLIGGIAGDLTGSAFGFRATWLLGALVMLIAFGATYRCMDAQGEPAKRLTEMQALKASLKALKLNSGLIWAVLVTMTLGFVNPFNHLWNQFFEPRLHGHSLSWIWIPLYGSCALSAVIVRRLKFTKGREAGAMLGVLGLSGLGLTFVGHFPGLSWPLAIVVIHEIGRGAYVPLADVFVQRRIASGYRATYGSLHSFLSRMGNMFVLAGVWFFTRGIPDSEFKIVSIWTVCGALLVLCTLALYLFRPRSLLSEIKIEPGSLPAQS
ncbi:MAG: MFS transporter [Patescibacteria group bacterium]|jgi:hypothetical protein